MKTIAILNHKGGTGKTTSTINIGAGLALKGFKVLCIDFDPQANLTEGLGIKDPELSIYDSIRDKRKLPIVNISENLDIVPSSVELLGAEVELVNSIAREKVLTKLIHPVKPNYDYILIDCPPALGLLSINAIVASDTILLPLEPEYFAYKGVDRILGVIQEVKENLNENLTIGGVFITRCSMNRTLTKTIIETIRNEFEYKVFDTVIRTNVLLGEAQLQGISIYEHAPKSNGAKDYGDLVNEILDTIK
tara:strand:- start:806 stop:1552 length:747 start_codon:yes stop_codon:yes gene_type:complete